MDRHVYVVCAADEGWSITLNGSVIGTFARRRDALLAAVICSRTSRRIGHETEVLARSGTGKTRAVLTLDYRGVGQSEESE
jgi:hypothetical protein